LDRPGVDACFESALQMLVNVMEKSGNLRNDLRKDILNSVSELRKSFPKMKMESLEKNEAIITLQNDIKKERCNIATIREGRVKPFSQPGYLVGS
jgi:hypothetical protein